MNNRLIETFVFIGLMVLCVGLTFLIAGSY